MRTTAVGMRWWLVAAAFMLAATPAGATSYAVRVRWRPSADTAVTGYRVYRRVTGASFSLALDAGLPMLQADGTLGALVQGLAGCTGYGFAVTAYHADRSESALSNEVTISYAAAAPLIDTDHDGLVNSAEDRNLNCVVDPGETDPDRADTDGDGVLDGQDACQGTAAGAAVNASGCSCAQITCDDGNPCNGVETCQAGVCQRGVAPSCDDGNACTQDACNSTTGCTHTPIAGCTACTTAASCNDGNPCTTDSCVGGQCAHVVVADGTSCSDGNYCNGAETCRAGVCQPGVAPSCDDGNPCTQDSCGGTGCVHTTIPGCSTCTAAASCNDGNPCTTDSCVGGVCAHTAVSDGTSCSDGLYCNGAETCHAGSCTAGTAIVCDDGNACTADACDETQKACTYTPVPDGTPCDDNNVCTSNDTCTAGVCGAATAHAVLAVAANEDSTITVLRMRTTGGGTSVTARAVFPAPDGLALDLDGVALELRDETGRLVYEKTVARNLFDQAPNRAVYRQDDRATGGALTRIELRARGTRATLALRAVVPAQPVGLAALVSDTTGSTELRWSLQSKSGCVKGKGSCKTRGVLCR
jgi:slime mold repeat-containing protein